MGANIIVGGLVLQLLFFALFIGAAVAFAHKVREHSAGQTSAPSSDTLCVQDVSLDYCKHLRVLYAVSGLIMLRNVLRVIEYAQGQDGYLLGHEWVLYIFDAVPMVAVMVLLNIWHGSEIMAFLRGHGKFAYNAFWMTTFDGERI